MSGACTVYSNGNPLEFYEGEFEADEYSGSGKLFGFSDDGRKRLDYFGQLKHNARHGSGTSYFGNGKQHSPKGDGIVSAGSIRTVRCMISGFNKIKP